MNQNIIYIDCFSGISGDKFLSALYNLDLIKEKQFYEAVNNLNIKDFSLKDIFFEETQKKGFNGLSLKINLDKASVKFKTIHEVNKQIDLINFKNEIKNDIRFIYNILFEAESCVHGKSLKDLHLHEIASIDTLIDISLSAFIINELNLKNKHQNNDNSHNFAYGNYNIICSKINLGSGIIDIAHGALSVPPPAVSYILKEIPVYGFGDDTELTTPTGAALIKYYASGYSEKIPSMEIISEGYGCGSKDLDRLANILRIFYGKLNKHSSIYNDGDEYLHNSYINYDEIAEIQCNIDDMNPEIYDFVIEKLFKNGALDVFLTPVMMKKNRPGIVLNVLCDIPLTKKLSKVIMEETTSIGLRIARKDKIYIDRFIEEIETPFGTIKIKVSKAGNKILNKKPEYESLKKIALNNNISLKEVYNVVNKLIK
ncbi:MAG: nickel pincer cofactor biosynthesis protein LarC [Deltaproteobacteria bacterium]|nr:nickel pincer cofactor biosynthesis protein LarC [Deltaproteobacteria bacterium]